jgi:hypothetical protein
MCELPAGYGIAGWLCYRCQGKNTLAAKNLIFEEYSFGVHG